MKGRNGCERRPERPDGYFCLSGIERLLYLCDLIQRLWERIDLAQIPHAPTAAISVLRHDPSSFPSSFCHNAWSKKARSLLVWPRSARYVSDGSSSTFRTRSSNVRCCSDSYRIAALRGNRIAAAPSDSSVTERPLPGRCWTLIRWTLPSPPQARAAGIQFSSFVAARILRFMVEGCSQRVSVRSPPSGDRRDWLQQPCLDQRSPDR
jgi:hypothetical protein